jgi:NMD protein affecting ribosome stability and mRNA decay
MEKNAASNYFEAILQLRNTNQEVTSCVFNAIKKQKDIFVMKEVEYKDGFDLYISSQKFAHQLGKLLKKSFKGKLLETRRLHGRDRHKGKSIYRRTVLFRVD